MLELDVFLHSWSDFSVSVINANLVFQLNKITFIGVSLFHPNSFPLLTFPNSFPDRKSLYKPSAYN